MAMKGFLNLRKNKNLSFDEKIELAEKQYKKKYNLLKKKYLEIIEDNIIFNIENGNSCFNIFVHYDELYSYAKSEKILKEIIDNDLHLPKELRLPTVNYLTSRAELIFKFDDKGII